ncbi:unnamed protein product [Cladocopium goreaui]|uniref:Uncharacterized protein n=1 Tax=Cladocopium goreaui TaxID=2562237 RepID=A0A9P1CV00_9DINO|nr:unnamed protein product [Cladocopium goreaui]
MWLLSGFKLMRGYYVGSVLGVPRLGIPCIKMQARGAPDCTEGTINHYSMALLPAFPEEDLEELDLQKDTGFVRGISDGTTDEGLPPLEDLEDFEEDEEYEEPERGLAIRPSRMGLKNVPGMEDVVVKTLPNPKLSLKERMCLKHLEKQEVSKFPARTWAVTPESREALKPPSVEDQHEQRSVEFHPMVTCHLFRS